MRLLLWLLLFASVLRQDYVLNHSHENELQRVQVHFPAHQTHFLKTRFETEAQGNSEMAYWLNSAYEYLYFRKHITSTGITVVKLLLPTKWRYVEHKFLKD